MARTLVITTSGFYMANPLLRDLEAEGWSIVRNPFGRKMTEDEVSELLQESGAEAMVAGAEPLTDRVFAEKEHVAEPVAERGGGGNYYNTKPVQVGKRFARELIASTLEGRTPVHRGVPAARCEEDGNLRGSGPAARSAVVAYLIDSDVFIRAKNDQTVGSRRLSPSAVAQILKRSATAAGIPADRLAGDSLRAGHTTTAAQNGEPDRIIMRQTGQKRPQTFDVYVRPTTVFEDNSASYLNLDHSGSQR